MRMYTEAFNSMRELNLFVNREGIQKEQIVNIFPSLGSYVLIYYGE